MLVKMRRLRRPEDRGVDVPVKGDLAPVEGFVGKVDDRSRGSNVRCDDDRLRVGVRHLERLKPNAAVEPAARIPTRLVWTRIGLHDKLVLAIPQASVTSQRNDMYPKSHPPTFFPFKKTSGQAIMPSKARNAFGDFAAENVRRYSP